MAGICFYFEDYDVDVYSGRRIDLDAWNYAIQSGGQDMDTLLMLNRTTQKITSPNSRLSFSTLDDTSKVVVPELEGTVAYFCPPPDPRVAETLWDFDHNVDWYCFGPSGGFKFEPKPGDRVVGIPLGPVDLAGVVPGQIHSVHTASIVMAHRYHVKFGGK